MAIIPEEDDQLHPGAIKRLLITDFLTYDNVEIFPQAHLNLTIGPNGTGKSTIMCAIFLVCGGTPKCLGRSTQMIDYIKHGKNSAHVQAEIVGNAGRCNPVIDLFLRRSGNSAKYHLDGKEITRQKLLEFLETYNIQVENLCQFLAQDRVVEFARQSNQELLESTEEAAGQPGLYEKHQRLKNSVETVRKWDSDASTLGEKVKRIQANLKQLAPEVDNAKRCKSMRDKLEQLKRKRCWLEYERERQTYMSLNDDKQKFQQLFDESRGKCKDVENDLNRISSLIDRHSKPLQEKKNRILNDYRTAEAYTDQISEKRDQVHYSKIELEKIDQEHGEQQANIRKVEELIESLTNQYREAEIQEENIDNQIREVQNDLRRKESKIYELEQNLAQKRAPYNNIKMELQNVDRELSSIGALQERQLLRLRHLHANAYNAYTWYIRNTERFSGKVYLPVLSVTVRDRRNTKFVDTAVPRREWFMFVFEKYSDLDLFSQCVKRELNINYLGCAHTEKLPRQNVEPMGHEMKKLGFRAYVAEMFDAPDAVKNYLISISQLNRIPVGDERVENNIADVINRIPNSVTNFMTENKRIFIRTSKYSHEKIVTDNVFKSADILMDSVDDSAVESLNSQKLNLESQLNNGLRELEALSAEIRSEEQSRERLRQQKAELENRNRRKAQLAQQIKIKKTNLANLQRSLIDIPSKKREIHQQIAENLNNIKKLLIMISDVKTSNSWREYVVLLSEISTLYRKQRQLNEEKVAKLTDKDNKKRMLDTVKQDLQTKRQEVLELLRQANELLDCDLELDEENLLSQRSLPADVTAAFQRIPDTIQEIDVLMEDLQARLMVTRGADNDAIERYEQLKLECVTMEADRQKCLQNIELLQNELGEERESWLIDLQTLINRINENFSKFFQLFACAGEVELDRGVDQADYSQYGIKIRVKFRREDKELRELTHQRQSGGERSVSTMLYLLALQELSNMPFRCVDEINQGMDARNERKVFNLMVKLMKRSKKSGSRLFSAQYFMLTPKLLPNLHFSDHVTLLIVQNGKTNEERKFDVADVSRRQSMIVENAGENGESDQGED